MKRKIIISVIFLNYIAIFITCSFALDYSGINHLGPNDMGILDIEISGRTYTNILGKDGDFEESGKGQFDGWQPVYSHLKNVYASGDNHVLEVTPNGKHDRYFYTSYSKSSHSKMKSNTYYVILGDVTVKNNTNLNKVGIYPNGSNTFYDSTYSEWKYANISQVDQVQTVGSKFKTRDNVSYSYFIALGKFSDPQGDRTSASFQMDNVCVVELTDEEFNNYSVDQLIEKYKYVENSKSTMPFRITSCGKNLLNPNYIEIGGISSQDGVNIGDDKKYRLTSPVRVKTGHTYSVSTERNKLHELYKYKDGTYIGRESMTNPFKFTPNNTYNEVKITFGDSSISAEAHKVQIEKGEYSTTYEPYVASVSHISFPETMKGLNSINDNIADEVIISGTKQEVIQKTFHDIIDGSLEWNDTVSAPSNYPVPSFYTRIDDFISSNNLSTRSSFNFMVSAENIEVEPLSHVSKLSKDVAVTAHHEIDKLFVVLSKSYLDSQNSLTNSIDSVKQFLNTNPIVFIHELNTYMKYNLSSGPLVAYRNGTVFIEPVIKDVLSYNGELSISNPELPIENIQSIYKISPTGRILIESNEYSIGSDGTIVQISSAKQGEIYELIYHYSRELTTMPKVEVQVESSESSKIDYFIQNTTKNSSELDDLKSLINVLINMLNENETGNISIQYDENGNLTNITTQ
ncbi:hypothetical protein [Fusibacter sp. JL216-2]|uniref:hypothetical protein n=1 Tax=Fusibacter sp. JL216-2 TaxID=3071453 RepID=UPI003D33A4DC